MEILGKSSLAGLPVDDSTSVKLRVNGLLAAKILVLVEFTNARVLEVKVGRQFSLDALLGQQIGDVRRLLFGGSIERRQDMADCFGRGDGFVRHSAGGQLGEPLHELLSCSLASYSSNTLRKETYVKLVLGIVQRERAVGLARTSLAGSSALK